jgi:hypothetical protein
MFFTRVGQIIAWLLFIMGALRCGLGVVGAFSTKNAAEMQFFAQRYLAAETTGEAINDGMMKIFAAVCLGVLVEISRNLSQDK